jgi:hypothetical protein
VSETLMPGGGVSRRPLHFIAMGDCSGSMKGPKMQALNTALRAMLPHLLAWEREQLQAQLLIRILGFATIPRWHVPEPTPTAELNHRWIMTPEGEPAVTVPPARRLGVRTMVIDFGSVHGRIRIDRERAR